MCSTWSRILSHLSSLGLGTNCTRPSRVSISSRDFCLVTGPSRNSSSGGREEIDQEVSAPLVTLTRKRRKDIIGQCPSVRPTVREIAHSTGTPLFQTLKLSTRCLRARNPWEGIICLWRKYAREAKQQGNTRAGSCSPAQKKVHFLSPPRVFGRSLRGSIFFPLLPLPPKKKICKNCGCALSEKVPCQISEMTFQKFFLKEAGILFPFFAPLMKLMPCRWMGQVFPNQPAKKQLF